MQRLRSLLLSSFVLAGCTFAPDISSGRLTCGEGNSCPRDLQCNARRICCARGDNAGPCAPVPDGGAAADGATAGELTVAPVPRRLSEGPAELIGYYGACTRARTTASTDRWCAFTREQELWVLNVSRALAGTVRCDGTDDACLRLTTTLYRRELIGQPVSVTEFHGDLLLFPAEALAPENERYRGGIFAWYPGWPAARRLTSENGFACLPAREAPTVACVDRAPGATPGMFDLLAGPAAMPLQRVKRAVGEFAVGLASNGRWLLYEEAPAPRPATLWLAPMETVADPATHVAISKNVVSRQWTFATYSPQIYFLRDDPPGPYSANPTVATTNARSPAMISDVAPRVGVFRTLDGLDGTDLGVAVVQDLDFVESSGVLKLFFNGFGSQVVVGTVTQLFTVSPDGRYTMFAQVQDKTVGRFDTRIADHEGSSVCALQREARAVIDSFEAFTSNGELAFWYDFPDGSRTIPDGWMARSKGCGERRKFAERLLVHYVIGNTGLLYLDQAGPASPGGVLKYVKWGPDMAWPAAGPLSIQSDVDVALAMVEPDRKIAVFTSLRPGSEGVYAVQLP
jgi:hypothetical protein